MPVKWEDLPELYLEHPNGVKVWRTYNGRHAMDNVFTTRESDDDAESGSAYVFDVYDLPDDPELKSGDGDAIMAARIVHAIDKGLLPLPEENQPTGCLEQREPYEYCKACTVASKLEREGVTAKGLEKLVSAAAKEAAVKANEKGMHAQVEFLLNAGLTLDNIIELLKGIGAPIFSD